MKAVDALVQAMLPRHTTWPSMDYGENMEKLLFYPLAGFARVLVGIAQLTFLWGVQVETCETERLDCSCLTIHTWAENDKILYEYQ